MKQPQTTDIYYDVALRVLQNRIILIWGRVDIRLIKDKIFKIEMQTLFCLLVNIAC